MSSPSITHATSRPSLLSRRGRALTPSVPSAATLREPVVVGHRGASAHAPENTLAALSLAVAQGAGGVEMDVQRTRDGALVLMHDLTVDRTTDAEWRIGPRRAWHVGELTLAQVRRLDAGRGHGRAFAGVGVPTLAEAMELLRPTGVHALVELKCPQRYPGLAEDVADEVRRLGVAHSRVTVQSFDVAAMRALSIYAPELRIGVLGAPGWGQLRWIATWAEQVNPSHRRIDGRFVDTAHALGLEVQAWTVNAHRTMRRVVELGVDGVITDRPDRLRALLDLRAERAGTAGSAPLSVPEVPGHRP